MASLKMKRDVENGTLYNDKTYDETAPSGRYAWAVDPASHNEEGLFTAYCLPSRRRYLKYFALAAVFIILATSTATSTGRTHLRAAVNGKIPSFRVQTTECESTDYPCLIDTAFAKFDDLIARQSKTVPEALTEYSRRYNRPPPAGMAEWFEYALQKHGTLIDEYGQLEADLSPFRQARMTKQGSERMVASLMERFHKSEIFERTLGVLQIKDGVANCTGETWEGMSSATLLEMIRPIQDRLPDVSMVYNWNSRPMVFGTDGWTSDAPNKVTLEDVSHKSAWDLLREPCPAKYLTNSSVPSAREDIDVCKIQGIHAEEHGMFVSPSYLFATKSLVPVISRGKMSTNRDILAPNTCYWTEYYRQWSSPDPTPFESKQPRLFWRGVTSGIRLSRQTWLKSHRMRFVAFAHYLRGKALAAWREARGDLTLLPAGSESAAVKIDYHPYEALELYRFSSNEVDHFAPQLDPTMFDIGFNGVNDADEETDKLVNTTYGMVSWQPPEYQFQNQFHADIDGESMSCRFYFQLASNSVPIKQTLFAEWHDDRIMPWVHYIPLSTNYGELPRLLAWLTTDKGQIYAKRIAEAGKEWAAKSLRKQDLTLFYYRMLLEYASIFA